MTSRIIGSHVVSQAETLQSTPTVADLRAALPGADAEFILEVASGGLSIEEAQRRFIQQLQQRPQEVDTAPRPRSVPGNSRNFAPMAGGRVEDSAAGGSDSDFSELVEQAMGRGLDRQQAVATVARKHPAAHQEFLRSTQRSKGSLHSLERKIDTFS